ncbi:MAG: hypothetical protein GY898_16190, partial [Proteobacteria bacterium]|nr:hypothetical protein [Pseudomonadota bacterium]
MGALIAAVIPDVALGQQLQPLSPRHLVVALEDGSDPQTVPSDWTVTSETDPAFADPRNPVAVGFRSRAAALIPKGWPYAAILEHEVFLELPDPVRPGATYRVRCESLGLDLDWASAPDEVLTPSIHLNQVGFLPDAPLRMAYVSAWLGTLGPMELFPDERAFTVVDVDTGDAVLHSELTLRMSADASGEDEYDENYTHTHVYEADLGALDAPGRYHLVLAGTGRSFEFEVGPAIYDEPFRTSARGLFQQRCGTALLPEHTDWPHGECHVTDVVLTTADHNLVGSDAFGALVAQATAEVIQVHGGHHDAGDYDRHVGHLRVVDDLVDLVELDAARFSGEGMGLPESGNGVPDLLDEARWAIDLYRQLQRADGAISRGVETDGYPVDWGTMPEDDVVDDSGGTRTWYAYAYDVNSSYRFAGAASKLARALAPWDADDADELAAAATRAWDWAEANPPQAYSANAALRAYAAAELLHTTGDERYDAAFQLSSPFGTHGLAFSFADWDDGGWISGFHAALWRYAGSDRGGAAFREASLRALTERTDLWIAWGDRTSYRIPKQPYQPIGFGSASTPFASALLFRMHALTGQPEYRTWGITNVDQVLGGNPSGRSWTTGIGDNPVRRPLHHPSLADGIDEPVPGITVYGPAHYEDNGGIHGSVIAAFNPPIAQWPRLERFADVSYSPLVNEFTVGETLSPTAFALGYLAASTGVLDEVDDDPSGDDPGDDPGVDQAPEGCDCASSVGGAGAGGIGLLLLVMGVGARIARSRGAALGMCGVRLLELNGAAHVEQQVEGPSELQGPPSRS